MDSPWHSSARLMDFPMRSGAGEERTMTCGTGECMLETQRGRRALQLDKRFQKSEWQYRHVVRIVTEPGVSSGFTTLV